MTRLSLRTNGDVQLADSIRQGRPFHTQPCGRAIRTTNLPVGCSNRPQHVLTLHFLQGAQLRTGRLDSSLFQLRNRWTQYTPRR